MILTFMTTWCKCFCVLICICTVQLLNQIITELIIKTDDVVEIINAIELSIFPAWWVSFNMIKLRLKATMCSNLILSHETKLCKLLLLYNGRLFRFINLDNRQDHIGFYDLMGGNSHITSAQEKAEAAHIHNTWIVHCVENFANICAEILIPGPVVHVVHRYYK